MDNETIKAIATRLIEWFESRGRKFPWRKEKMKPYEVLIAEMMLQKTRAEMVMKVYSNFLEKYPSIKTLASASVEEIARFLKPLGLYNRRAKWMKAVSEIIMNKYGGRVPEKENDLMNLPGIGDYIAHAILCFAYNRRVPIVDVNVARVLGRVTGIKVSRDLRRDTKIREVATKMIPGNKFKEFNWALVDLGALVCTPKLPKHHECPIASFCKFLRRRPGKSKSKS